MLSQVQVFQPAHEAVAGRKGRGEKEQPFVPAQGLQAFDAIDVLDHFQRDDGVKLSGLYPQISPVKDVSDDVRGRLEIECRDLHAGLPELSRKPLVAGSHLENPGSDGQVAQE